ncbi:MAG: DUF4293 family protein [Bacteroidales bacterium]|nr:DUF4293 family protein [Bacteroidales bacterium]
MVLQRLQSLYLLIAAILLGVFTFTTSTTITTGDTQYLIGAMATGTGAEAAPNYVLCILNALTAVLALVTIFKYKNLKLQLKLCSICITLTLAIAASIGILTYQAMNGGEVQVMLSNVLLALAVVFFFLARRGVAHDKKVIHDSESFR